MDRLDPVEHHCHKLQQGLKESFWGSVWEKFSVNIKMNHSVRNMCGASFMPAVTSCNQVHAQNADTHIPICRPVTSLGSQEGRRVLFWTMSNIFKLRPTHFSRGAKIFLEGASSPLRPPPGYGPAYLRRGFASLGATGWLVPKPRVVSCIVHWKVLTTLHVVLQLW